MFRKFQPKISRSTSLNVGLSYYQYQMTELSKDYTQSLVSIPLQIMDKNNDSILSEYKVNLLYGAGIEIDIFKGIYLKSEYRYEAFAHPIIFGIGYIFKNN